MDPHRRPVWSPFFNVECAVAAHSRPTLGRMTDAPLPITKLDAARRQLDTAIRLLFAGEDPVSVHTLVGAASVLFSDLIELEAPDRSWDRQAQAATGMSKSEYFQIMRRAQNFFKHARDDHDAQLEFDPSDTEALTFWAVMNASELAPMSPETEVFQLWYVASSYPDVDPNDSPLREAIELFGDLRGAERAVRLEAGRRLLEEHRCNAA